jgi:hypothetical protein
MDNVTWFRNPRRGRPAPVSYRRGARRTARGSDLSESPYARFERGGIYRFRSDDPSFRPFRIH